MKATTTHLALQIQRAIPHFSVRVEDAGNNESESIYIGGWVVFMPTLEDPTFQVFQTFEIGEGDKKTLKLFRDGDEDNVIKFLKTFYK